MSEDTAIKLLRYCLDARTEVERLEEAGVAVRALSRYEEVFKILLDDIGFPRDETAERLRQAVRPRLFCRDQLDDVFAALPADASDEALRAAIRAWREMSKDLAQFYI